MGFKDGTINPDTKNPAAADRYIWAAQSDLPGCRAVATSCHASSASRSNIGTARLSASRRRRWDAKN
ncbi:hypothetical protein [Asaia platycodi]|uniref:hypothetical protein n=1 Tax=Asaia platycodi TaxID=610243 RepID=UPI0034E2DEFB